MLTRTRLVTNKTSKATRRCRVRPASPRAGTGPLPAALLASRRPVGAPGQRPRHAVPATCVGNQHEAPAAVTVSCGGHLGVSQRTAGLAAFQTHQSILHRRRGREAGSAGPHRERPARALPPPPQLAVTLAGGLKLRNFTLRARKAGTAQAPASRRQVRPSGATPGPGSLLPPGNPQRGRALCVSEVSADPALATR